MCINKSGRVAHKAEGYKVFSVIDGGLYSCFQHCISSEYKMNEVLYAGFFTKHSKWGNNFLKRYPESLYQYTPKQIRNSDRFSAFETKDSALNFVNNIENKEKEIWSIERCPKVVKRVLMWDVEFGELGVYNSDIYRAMDGAAILIYPEDVQ